MGKQATSHSLRKTLRPFSVKYHRKITKSCAPHRQKQDSKAGQPQMSLVFFPYDLVNGGSYDLGGNHVKDVDQQGREYAC